MRYVLNKQDLAVAVAEWLTKRHVFPAGSKFVVDYEVFVDKNDLVAYVNVVETKPDGPYR